MSCWCRPSSTRVCLVGVEFAKIKALLGGLRPAGSGFMLQEILLFLLFPTVAATENGSGSFLLCLVSEGAAQSWVLAASCGFKQYRTVVNNSEAGAARSPAKHALKLRERTAAFAVRALRVWLLFGYCSLITVSNKPSLEN